jgi:Ca2+-binding EF-hand superfamily protein
MTKPSAFRTPTLLALLLPVAAGCGAPPEGVDEEDLLLAAVTSETEDLFVGDFVSDPDLDPADLERPGLGGACDAGAHFARLRAAHHGHRPARDHRRRHPRLLHLVWIYDADNDGALSESERAQMLSDFTARCEARRARLLEAFDTNGDGVLDEGEIAAARQAARACREARRQAFLARIDTDGDGRLSIPERLAAHEARLAQFAERRAAVVAEFDLDRNGTLDDTERAAARAALRERIRSGGEPRCS